MKCEGDGCERAPLYHDAHRVPDMTPHLRVLRKIEIIGDAEGWPVHVDRFPIVWAGSVQVLINRRMLVKVTGGVRLP